ncbi:hypothetical protein GCM10010211_10100 [Streptomyces albospinus]|uniref:Uncharacterized protein n=1 Tax=Streptomyces albospinus TaxID=285515 RepID=A0ABQ2URH6_9ACTN|nr:hypothetical protein GCM10010211_10100 [Streptomyces albospinus]
MTLPANNSRAATTSTAEAPSSAEMTRRPFLRRAHQHRGDRDRVVDDLAPDVFACGITTDFRSKLFPGSQRLVELADRIEVLQVEVLCWCGARATHNARTVDGRMVVEGAQVVVGDMVGDAVGDGAERPQAEVGYEVPCRRHHRRRQTSATARAAALSPDVLPVDAAR